MRSRMTDRITRRDVLRFGTTAAASVALRPLIERSMETRAMEPDHQLASINENMDTPAASDSDICFLSARGIRTTFGSPLHKDDIPNFDCLVVEREKNAGAIVIGKTNVPEWGLGSQTFNPVFGPTLNPYDLTKTCGGSTGGGSVALACGMVPLADGSHMGGSLRNPPHFCNVVGLRTSPGR